LIWRLDFFKPTQYLAGTKTVYIQAKDNIVGKHKESIE